MLGVHNSVAADGQKPLVGWQKLSATAEPSRYAAKSPNVGSNSESSVKIDLGMILFLIGLDQTLTFDYWSLK
jgi:hypothetical protein